MKKIIQFFSVINQSPLYGSASEIGVPFRGSLYVRSGFAMGLLCVRSGFALGPLYSRPRPDPDRIPKANPRSGLGPLSVRLSLVGTVNPIKVCVLCSKNLQKQTHRIFQTRPMRRSWIRLLSVCRVSCKYRPI